MADVRAIASGNWSNTAIWNTGALPTSADDVWANTYTVAADTTTTVLSIRNGSTTNVTAGGGFTAVNGVTLTLTGSGVVAGSTATTVFTSSLTAGQSCALVGNLTAANGAAAENTSTGTLNVTGNCTGGSTNRHGVNNTSTGTANITGNCNGSSSSGGIGANNASTGTLNIIGTATANTAQAVSNASTGTLNHTGTVQASNTVPGITGTNAGQVTILTGPFLTSTNGINPVTCTRWFWQNTTPPATYYQIRSANLSVIRPLYTADSVGGNPATSNVRSGTVYGPNSELTGTCAVPPAGSVALGVPVDNTTGTAVLTQANFQSALDAQGLTSARAANLDNLDATVSSRLASASYTAPLSASGTRTALGLASANLDTQLSVLTNLDTTVSSRLATSGYTAPLDAAGTRTAVGLATANLDTQLAPIPNLDATVSSRLAASSYQTPLDAAGTRAAVGLASANLDSQLDALPTAVENASAVRTELTPELDRIDVATSTRSTFNPATDTVANVTLVGTTTNLTNPPDVPTTGEIADAVRIELTPELDRIDADVSSRLASVDYTTPPTALENAQAVEIQLSLPLGNMDVAVSTRSTFNPTTDTVAQVTLVDTTTDLTNPPVVPTPEQIATAVRVELEPELERIDVDVSSRLATTDYEQPPTPEQNAEAVRTELTPELDRVSNCATVATTGQQIQNALST